MDNIKIKTKIKYFVSGVILTTLLFATILSVSADSMGKTITAVFSNIKIYLDGNPVKVVDSNGTTVEPFMYNGSVYIPIDTLGTILGKKVNHNSVSNTVFIGKESTPPQEITLRLGDFSDNSGQVWDDIISSFSKYHPEIKVNKEYKPIEYNNYPADHVIFKDIGADILSCIPNNLAYFVNNKAAKNLDGFFSKEFISQFDSKMVNDFKYQNGLYAIPYRYAGFTTLIYNKKMVKSAPATMSELIALSKKLNKQPNQYGLVMPAYHPFYFWSFYIGFGGKMFDDKGNPSLNNEAMKNTAQLMYDLTFTHKLLHPNMDYTTADNLFKQGKAAFIINGIWSIQSYKNAGVDVGVACIPKLSNGNWPVPYYTAKVLIVNSKVSNNSKKLSAIKTFIEYVNTPGIQLKLTKMGPNDFLSLPTNKVAAKDPSIQSDPIL